MFFVFHLGYFANMYYHSSTGALGVIILYYEIIVHAIIKLRVVWDLESERGEEVHAKLITDGDIGANKNCT